MININQRIKELRKALNLSQDAFAARLGLTRGAITNIELGKTEPKPLLVQLICREFNVNEYWLHTGNGEMFEERSMEEEIAAFARQLINFGPDSFRTRFVSALSKLDENEWDVLEKIIDEMAAGNKKDRE